MLIDKIKEYVTTHLSSDEKKDCIIRGLWDTTCLYNPAGERFFNFDFLIAKTLDEGCAYLTKKPARQILEEVIGCNYFDVCDKLDKETEIAVLDSIFGAVYQIKPQFTYLLNGSSLSKAMDRAQIVVKEIEELIRLYQGPSKKYDVVNVGVIGLFLKLLSKKHYKIVGTDFDENIVDTIFYDVVNIVDGKNTLDCIAQAKVAAVTGMTLTTNTLDDIINCAKAHKTKLLVFAETGFNLARYYLREGVDIVVCEPFPFYIFDGETSIKVYKNEEL